MDRPNSVPPNALGKSAALSEDAKYVSSQQMADLKKENFSLKLKIYYLETTLSKVSGLEHFDAVTENVQLKVQNESLSKELESNKDLLIKASALVDSLTDQDGFKKREEQLRQENEELTSIVEKLENELLKAKDEIEGQSLELEHVHTDVMLLEDQLRQKNEEKERNENMPDNMNEKLDVLTTKLDTQELLYQADKDQLKSEITELHLQLKRSLEENQKNKLLIAEKEKIIEELQNTSSKDGIEEGSEGQDRTKLLEMLSHYTDTNSQLEQELESLEQKNTELNNVINTLKTEKEELSKDGEDEGELAAKLRDYQTEIEHLRQEINDLKLAGSNQPECEALVAELTAAKDELQELRYNLSQLKKHSDIAESEAALLRGNIEETEQLKHENEVLSKSLRQNIEKLSKDNAEYASDNNALHHDNDLLRDRVQELNKEISDLKEENKRVVTQFDRDSMCRVNELTEELLSLRQTLSDTQEELKFCKDDMKTLESNYEGSCEELELLEEELKSSEAKRVQLTDELDELKEEFMKSKVTAGDDCNKMKQKVGEKEKEVGCLQKQLDKLLKENKVLEQKSRSSTTAELKLKQTERELQRVTREVTSRDLEVTRLNSVADHLNAEVEAMAVDNAKIKGISEGDKRRISMLEAEVDELKPMLAAKDHQIENLRCHVNNLSGKLANKEQQNTQFEELEARKLYMINRIKELEESKQSLEDSVYSLKDQLSNTPIQIYSSRDESKYEGESMGEVEKLKVEIEHHRTERKDLEKELQRIHEAVHDTIRQLHKHHVTYRNSSCPLVPLTLNVIKDDFLVSSLVDAVELLVNGITSRQRQVSNTSSTQTTTNTSGIATGNATPNKDFSAQEDIAALQRENALLHTDLMESKDLIAALRREMKDLIEKLDSANVGDTHVKNMLSQINTVITRSLLKSPDKATLVSLDSNVLESEVSDDSYHGNDHVKEITANQRLVEHRLKSKEAKLAEVEAKLKESIQELSTTQCKLTATQSKLAVAEHKIQGLSDELYKQNEKFSSHINYEAKSEKLQQKLNKLQAQLVNTEEILKDKMKMVRDKNEVIENLLERSTTGDTTNLSFTASPHSSYLSPRKSASCGTFNDIGFLGSRPGSRMDLTPSTIQVSDYILLCASNWLEELPELMRALRDAVHNSLVDCKSVQTRVTERKATWAVTEVTRLSTRLDAVYRLLQHVENLSIQQPPSRLVHSLRQEVICKDNEINMLNDKLDKRYKDVLKLRSKLEDQDRLRTKQLKTGRVNGLNPSILSKVIDTETVLKEAQKSLERRMLAKESERFGLS